MEGYVGLARHLVCTSCLNHIFGGSSGFWGHKIIIPKVAPSRAISDGKGHPIVFQCVDCVTANRDPVVYPLVHPSGELVDHFNISTLQDASDQTEIKRAFGDYDDREEMAAIQKQSQIKQIKVEPPQVKVEMDNPPLGQVDTYERFTVSQEPALVKEGDANYKFSKDEESSYVVGTVDLEQAKELNDGFSKKLFNLKDGEEQARVHYKQTVDEIQEERARRTAERNKKFEEEERF